MRDWGAGQLARSSIELCQGPQSGLARGDSAEAVNTGKLRVAATMPPLAIRGPQAAPAPASPRGEINVRWHRPNPATAEAMGATATASSQSVWGGRGEEPTAGQSRPEKSALLKWCVLSLTPRLENKKLLNLKPGQLQAQLQMRWLQR
ncbi:hypothetical protein BP5796_00075 [Coleophoma crateriformis]|uniref:Uncharacterized protein n=1 Tax=Coleophoma crateriformis TaxID=565419 RepID=A0A3D8T6U4_9HELO|nr:hypothetical protein BP5796_00075 [Coleophoma crateriformis]